MKSRILAVVALVVGLTMSMGAFAQTAGPSFDNVQVTAQSHDFTTSDKVGGAVSVEKTLGSNVFVLGSVERASLHDDRTTNVRAGLGLILPLNAGLAGYGDVYGLHVSNVAYGNVHSYGYGAEAGLRDLIGNIQLSAAVNPERAVYNTGWTTYGKLGAQLNVTQHFAVVADYKYHDESDKVWNLGVAYNF